jgi:hypothetical protein
VSEISALVEAIRRENGCTVAPPSGRAIATIGRAIPEDLREFYRLCGVEIFSGLNFPWRISGPDLLLPTTIEGIGDQVANDITGRPQWVSAPRMNQVTSDA